MDAFCIFVFQSVCMGTLYCKPCLYPKLNVNMLKPMNQKLLGLLSNPYWHKIGVFSDLQKGQISIYRHIYCHIKISTIFRIFSDEGPYTETKKRYLT